MKQTIIRATLAASLLTGCVPVIIGGAAVGGYAIGKDERPVGTMADDATITASVKTALIKDEEIQARNISVSTYKGVVTLVGNVPSSYALNKAIVLARSQKGVKRVDFSQLAVN